MFQLIVAVISIALVAALAGASIYYGGSAFSGSTAKANVTSLINQGQQISGAVTLYRTDNSGGNPANIDALVTEYMQSVPTPPQIADGDWALGSGSEVANIALDSESAAAVCAEVVKQSGSSDTADDADTPPDGVQFACTNDNSHFVFSL